jgi:aminomuconate-semialdehyde/2-hydroxymuconate-6-semialdehyde dehydrogenase
MTSNNLYGHVIDGKELGSRDDATFDSIDPWLREPWAQIALGGMY